MPQVGLGAVQEVAHEADVLEVLPGDGAERRLVEAPDLGVGEREQHRGVGRDHELAALRNGVLAQQVQQCELASGREGHLGLVEEIEAAGHQPRMEEGQELLAVGAGIGVVAVARPQCARRACVGSEDAGELAGLEVRTLPSHPCRLGLEARHLLAHLLHEAEEVLGAQEEAPGRLPAPLEAHGPRQGAHGVEGLVAIERHAPHRDAPARNGQRLEEGALAGAVLSHEEGDGAPEAQRAERLQGRYAEGERGARVRVGGGDLHRAQGKPAGRLLRHGRRAAPRPLRPAPPTASRSRAARPRSSGWRWRGCAAGRRPRRRRSRAGTRAWPCHRLRSAGRPRSSTG